MQIHQEQDILIDRDIAVVMTSMACVWFPCIICLLVVCLSEPNCMNFGSGQSYKQSLGVKTD